MKFPLYIAKRYLFSKTSTNAINIITFIAVFSVVVGALALFVILSGFSGLRTFSDSLLNASDPDIKITTVKGKSFEYSDDVHQKLIKDTEIKTISKVIEERVFLKYKDKTHIAYIKGVDASYKDIIPVDSLLTVGTWVDPEFKNTAVIGYGISYKLSLGVLNFGAPLQIMVPKPGKGFVNANNAYVSVDTQVIGAYSGSEEFQNKYVFTELSLAQELLNYTENQISGIELKLQSTVDLDDFQEKLQQRLGANFEVKTRAQLNALYYKVINTENFISYLIFTLIIAIALFNVIGSIIMMIIDKRQNLKTLYNLGASIDEIKKIFVLQGFLLTIVGMIVGIVLGVLLVLIQQRYELFMITQNLAYPVEFRWFNLLVVMFTILILGYISAKIASSRISKSFIEK
ncbi:ABC transporter permease [Tenacibaculum finnmarkense]|uniref:FtsX-like permease family protein n=1 Tax=Tenacibaculum finnmarkense genomovar finnmarkense TaxID=1458503 RepID=A0AAP1RH10_9FLAO|nr:FtsX-like permease family protein [Tenacibaculum finnmarkense]MBE7653863.1 FtsX-like permease family protein [Tenacibaculum finnmarkense genomovar finnmarkense]MBE7696166.1 FtsX-like permease family protein [Tenacibaculum finnmarkense genomovar finnmarkense]MCD8428382.1 ABC transporter permease [Tenacibaculum finnmarkense genomovar finnmarkense]MCG8732154.1 ABC transporter permease [Tenacibaculum finnmarkense]MCG8752725.1 ABC transporter permease [Tenacibaculum finnmarkense]